MGVKKRQESQKARALWKMKVAKVAGKIPGPVFEYQRKKRNKISLLGGAPQRSNCCVAQSPKVRGISVLRMTVGSRLLWHPGCNDLRPGKFQVGLDLIPHLWDKPLCEEVPLPFLDAWDSVRPRTASTQWNVPGRYSSF